MKRGPHEPARPAGLELTPNEAVPEPIEPELMPAPSNVELGPAGALDTSASGAGLRPPGASSVAPIGIPTGPTEDVAPGTPKGDVAPIASAPGIGGVI